MNVSFAILGLSTLSMVMASLILYKLSVEPDQPRPEAPRGCQPDNTTVLTSLEDDFKDILSRVPLGRINEIFYDYLMYDRQIANTRSFIDDQAVFVAQEIENMPHMGIMIGYLRDMGLKVDYWHEEVVQFWKSLPRFERSDPGIAAGGLTVMIHKMMKLLPKDELHATLRAKASRSDVFKVFIVLLRSKLFLDVCHEIGNNDVLARHLHWAMEAGIEVIFALEFLRELYVYLIEGLV